jgi:hypothetical protein
LIILIARLSRSDAGSIPRTYLAVLSPYDSTVKDISPSGVLIGLVAAYIADAG